MIRTPVAVAVVIAATGLVAACQKPPASAAPATEASSASLPLPASPIGLSSTPAVGASAPMPVIQPSPDPVLRNWAAAIERRDWAAVRQLWGQNGAASGLSAPAFAARWDRLRRPHVTVGAGEQEGAAGSLYYTATVTVRDGARQWSTPVTLRRVNDVDGATAEQLRWHLAPDAQLPWVDRVD